MSQHLIILLTLCLALGGISRTHNSTLVSSENCSNEVDDDGDGLIDCFDDDCHCVIECEDHYAFRCRDSCFTGVGDIGSFNVRREWTFDQFWHEYNIAITGDIDNDGIPEVIGKRGPHVPGSSHSQYDKLSIIDGKTGLEKWIVDIPAQRWAMNAVAIGDLDRNGLKEIIVVASDFSGTPFPCQIFNFEYDGASSFIEKWRSDAGAFEPAFIDRPCFSPQITDFDGDGIAEVFVVNKIFDGLTGQMLVNTNDPAYIGRAFNTQFFHQFTLAEDILPDNACSDCPGTELIAGGSIYSIHIDRANPINSRIDQRVQCNKPVDGFTACADVDLDGDLDIVLSHGTSHNQAEIIVWEGQTGELLAPIHQFRSERGYVGIATIDDFDNDGEINIAVTGSHSFNNLEFSNGQIIEEWTNHTSDFSGYTSCISFDFNSDGVKELVYRDQTDFFILSGLDGEIHFQDRCVSGTASEYPVVVDVDNDSSAEILCSCRDQLIAYGSVNGSWVDTRPVWNQRNFFNTHINDDLTIPKHLQNRSIVTQPVINSFLAPIPIPRRHMLNLSQDSFWYDCDKGVVRLFSRICNTGEVAVDTNVNIAIYEGNPLKSHDATILATLSLNLKIPIDSCIDVELFELNGPIDTLTSIINDDGTTNPPILILDDFPNTSLLECSYLDNFNVLDTKGAVFPQIQDTSLCLGDSIVIMAPQGNWQHIWFDGSTDSTIIIDSSGIYSIQFVDQCGHSAIDSFRVSEDGYHDKVTHKICPSDSLLIEQKYYRPGDSILVTIPGIRCDTFRQHVVTSHILPSIDIKTKSVCNDSSTGSIYIDSSNLMDILEWYLEKNGQVVLPDSLEAGKYTVVIKSKDGCQFTKDVTIGTISKPLIQTDLKAADCHNDFTATLQVAADDSLLYSFNGNPKTDNGTFLGKAPQMVRLEYQLENCIYDTTFVLDLVDTLEFDLIVSVDGECSGEAYINARLKNATILAIDSIELLGMENIAFDDSLLAIVPFDGQTSFSVFVRDTHGCEYLKQVDLSLSGDSKIYVPNVFTPNGDNLNDVFHIYGSSCIKNVKRFLIFDRWGELVFQAENFLPGEKGWDGFLNDELMIPAVYTYMIEFENYEGTGEILTGSVTLLNH